MDATDIFEQEQRKKQVENHVEQNSAMEVNKQDVPLNAMSVQQKKQEDNQNALPAYAEVKVNEREQRVRDAINGRTISEILTKAVESSDSEEMAAVKDKVAVCNDILNKELHVEGDNTEFIEQQLRDLELSYLDAINACQYYCDHKSPMFREGKLRKKAVSDTLELLKKEMQLMPELHNMLSKENSVVNGQKIKFINLVAEAGIIKSDIQAAAEQKEDKGQEVKRNPIDNLTYDDFVKMLKTDSDNGIEFRGDSLRIVKSGIFTNPSNVTSENNKKMVERFINLAIQKVEKKQELSENQKANMKMRIQYQLDVKLLDTQAGAVSIGRMRDTMEMIDHLSSDVDYALKKDEHVSPMEHRFAIAVNDSLKIPEEKEVKKKVIHKRLQGMLTEAKKAGIVIPDISDDEINYIVENRLYAVRDQVFHDMQRIYKSMNCLNGGREVDFETLAMDKDTINNLIALRISRMSAATPAGVQMANYQILKKMENAAFAHCGDDSLKSEFNNTHISALAHGGSEGLREQVLNQISRTEVWKDKTGRVLNGMNNLSNLCSLLEKFSDMQSVAFSDGLTQEEAQQLQQLGAQLQEIIDQKDVLSDMELVTENMKGTRFFDGFRQLQETIKQPGAFTESAHKIVLAAKIKEKGQDVSEESSLAKAQEQSREKLGITEDIKHINISEVSEILSGLHGKEKDIAAVLLQEKKPSELIKKTGDDMAKSIAALYYALNSMASGDAWSDVTVAGYKLALSRRDSGDIELKIGNNIIPMPFTAAFMAYRIEQDMSENIDKYGDKVVLDALQGAFERTKQRILNQNENEDDVSRTLFLNVLKQKTGFDASFFRNMPVEALSQMAEYAMKGMMDKEDVKELVKSNENPNQIELNERDTLEMIKVLEQQKKSRRNAPPTVIMAENKKEEKIEENQWTPDEAELVELISDMVFSKDTWKVDMEQREPDDRLRMLMYDHCGLFAKIVKNPKLIDQTFSKLQISGIEDMAEAVKQQFEVLTNSDAMSKLKMLSEANMVLIFKAVLGDEQDMENAKPAINAIENAMKLAKKISKFSFMSFLSSGVQEEEEEKIDVKEMLLEQKKSIMDSFKGMDEDINEQTKMQVDKIQDKINESVGLIFDTKEEDKHKTIENMKLSEILEQNVKGQEGQGKFFKLVLTQYFRNANVMDQRAMIASAIRNVKPARAGKLSEEENEAQMGEFLGGFLKGAGPLLHKILQGLPMDGMPETLKLAISDMKSRLSPIAPEIVEARMNKMVMNSKGMIERIKIQRSLGAASIGQAFLCKIYGPNLGKDGKDVVIKLLRPDVQNHLEREKGFILKCASDTSPGMLKTFEGQLHAIEQELDLRVEAKNVERGKVYDKGVKTVKSMKTVDLVSPDTNALMLERAPGVTVDKYLEEAKAEYENIIDEYERTKIVDGGYAAMVRLQKLKEEMTKRQGYVAELAEKWLVSGIYEEGFYHGDLHAGNIMVDENGATVIDFGNATQITKEQQKSILHMVSAANAQNVDGFRHHFHLMLSPESEAVYKEKKEEFNDLLGTILFKDGDVGVRIAVILAEAQKLGLELPAALYNFSQCQIRLKNTMDDMVNQIDEMNMQLEEMNRYTLTARENADPFALIKEDVNNNIDLKARLNNGNSGDAPETLETLVKNKLHNKNDFDESEYRMNITAVPKNMGMLSRLHSQVYKLRSLDKNAELALQQQGESRTMLMQMCKANLEDFYNGMVNELNADTPEFLHLKDDMMKWFDKTDGNEDELHDYIGKMVKVKKNDIIDAYMSKLGEVLGPKLEGNPQRSVQAEEKLIEEAKKLYDIENPSMYQMIQGNLLSQDKSKINGFESMMKGWFADKDNYGEQLSNAYDKIKELKNKGEKIESSSQPVTEFMELLENAMVQRAYVLEQVEESCEKTDAKTFYDVMEKVVLDRLTSTIWSLGIKGIYRYLIKNNKKPVSNRAKAAKEASKAIVALDDVNAAILGIISRAVAMKEETDEEAVSQYKDAINESAIKNIPEKLNDLSISEDKKAEIINELRMYTENGEYDKKHLYNVIEIMKDIYNEKMRAFSGSDSDDDDWENALNLLKDA